MADDTNKGGSGADPKDPTPEHDDKAGAGLETSSAEPGNASSSASAEPGNESSSAPGEKTREKVADKGGTGSSELDPELLSLPRSSRGSTGPLLAISVIVFCLYIMTRIYGDMRFSRSSSEPVVYTSAAELVENADSEELVTVHAVPDRAMAVRVAHSQADDGSRMTPVQGTGGALWIMIGGNVWNAQLRHEEVYTGRLRRLADMPFADTLRSHVSARGAMPRFVSAEAAQKAREARNDSGRATVQTPAGDTVAVDPDTPVTIYETLANRARIRVFATDRHATEKDWTAALAEIGLIPADYQPESDRDESWVYVAEVPGGADAAQRALHQAKLFSASTDEIAQVHKSTWAELTSEGATLSVGQERLLWSNVDWIQVDVPYKLAADPMVLLTQEHPGAYWYVTPLFILLGLFALLFTWALIRSLGLFRRA